MMTERTVDEGIEVDERLTTSFKSNSEAFRDICRLYTRPNDIVGDLTYGKGVFWMKVDTGQYFATYFTDLAEDGVDMRDTTYPDEMFDFLVIDPPYRYNPKTATHPAGWDKQYQVGKAPSNIQGVIKLYEDGAREAHRILRRGGFLVVKCQDTIQSSNQWWVHMILTESIEAMGFYLKDLAVVTGQMKHVRWKVQKHLDKNHSYFLVFRKGGSYPLGNKSVQRRSN